MMLSVYILLRIAMHLQEYLGVFPDVDSAQGHATEIAHGQQRALLSEWKEYRDHSICAEAHSADGRRTTYIILMEQIALPDEEALPDDAFLGTC